ncbi:MAG: amidohydrolase family protein [Acidimicrobiia bacterium]|nr:amidohydrolase family protein [Acidimicrobiia bacterium]
MDPTQAAWLASTVEDAIDPEREIVDPHHHLWDHPKERFLVEELHAETGAGHNVVQTVYVDCMSGYLTDGPVEMRPVGEVRFALDQARQSETRGGARIAAIVSFADLALGDGVKPVLEAQIEAGDGRFRGIRHATSWDPSPKLANAHTEPTEGLMGTDAFRRGFAVLTGELGLVFDAWMYHPQLPDLVSLARAFPEATIVLDHIGGPVGVGPYANRRDEVLAAWRPPMAELAELPNVVLKVGGIGMALYGAGFHKLPSAPSSDDLVTYWGDQLRWCIDSFGPSRCMFESNFPVDRRGCSYTVLWNAFKKVAAGYSEAEKDDLFAGTARRAYRL